MSRITVKLRRRSHSCSRLCALELCSRSADGGAALAAG